MEGSKIYEAVQKHYSSAAKGRSDKYANNVAKAFGYSAEELATLPDGANLGLSCGNPIALGSFKAGETVIDFGSGAGFDAFLAAPKVGPKGKVIGVDMNKDMLTKANANKEKAGFANVEFVESQITKVALPDGIADCIISNCVVNLVPEPDKHLVFNEMGRLLKSGGRVAISDILAKKPFPDNLRKDIGLICGCISGASMMKEYEKYLMDAGFEHIMFMDNNKDLNVYSETEGDVACCGQVSTADKPACCTPKPSCCTDKSTCCTEGRPIDDPCCSSDKESCCAKEADVRKGIKLADINVNEWAGSYNILAIKGPTMTESEDDS